MKFWRSIRDKIARSEIRKGAVETSTKKTMGSQQAAAEDTHRRRGSGERRKQRRDNGGSATVDREAETAVSLDDELSTVSREATTVCRPHLLSLFFNSKIMEPAVRDKLPLGRITRRSSGEGGSAAASGVAIKLGRGIGMDVLLNDVHIPRTFAEVWFALAEGGSEGRWFIKNLSDKKTVRILYSDGSKMVLKQNEQGEVADSSELRLDTLKFTAKIEEGDMGKEYDFHLEFLPLDTDSSVTSSGSSSMPRQSSSDSGSSLSSARGLCRQRGGSERGERELHVGECVTTQQLPGLGLPLPGLTNSHVICDHNNLGAAAPHYHNQPCSNQGQMMLHMQGDLAQPHPQYFSAPRQPALMHYVPNHYPDCSPVLHPHNLPANPPGMLGSSQGPQPNIMNSTWPPGAMRGVAVPFSQVQSSGPAQGVHQRPVFPTSHPQQAWNPLGTMSNNQPSPGQMQFFPQSSQPGVADYSSLGGGTLYASFSQPVHGHPQSPNKPQPLHGPLSINQVVYNQGMTRQPEQQFGATVGHSTYVTQPESATMFDSHNEHWQSRLPRGIITTPTTHDQNPQLYASENRATPTQTQTDSQRLNTPVQVNSGSIETITTAFNDLMTSSSSYSLASHAEIGSRTYYAGTPNHRYDSSLTPLYSAEAATLTDHPLSMTTATAHAPLSPIIGVSSLNLPALNGNRVNLRMHEAIEAMQPQSFMYSDASIPLDVLRAPPVTPSVSESSRPDRMQLQRQPAEDDERQPQEHEEPVPQDHL